MAEVTEIWVWTVWEVDPVAVATEPTGETDETESPPASETEEAPPASETEVAPAAAPEVAGYAVDASDGHIGTVDEVSYDAGTGAIVVDTGHWIFGKKRMVPAGMIGRIDPESRVVTLSCTKADVKTAPDYEPSRADDASHREEIGEHYQAATR